MIGHKKELFGKTDYPFVELGDVPYQAAPMRNCRVIGFDGDKYCQIIVEGKTLEVKSGYIYGIKRNSIYNQLIQYE